MRYSARTAAALLAAVLCVISFAACQSFIQSQERQQRIQRHINIVVDRERVFVTTGDLNLKYKKLGDLSFTEPLNANTIDPSYINKKLRRMAILKWGDQVDAIIHLSSKTDANDTTITASGEAVSVIGDCAFCRHGYQKSIVPRSWQRGPD